MVKFVFLVALRRTADLLVSCVAISIVIVGLCVKGILPDRSTQLVVGLYIAAAAFVFINVRMMRRCYFEIRNTTVYFVANYCAYIAFGLLNLIVYKFCSKDVYTWIFAITKFGKYTNLQLATPWSATIFHAIMGISILLAPIGMGWVHMMREEHFVSKEMIPPTMEVEPQIASKVYAEVHTYEKSKTEETENTLS